MIRARASRRRFWPAGALPPISSRTTLQLSVLIPQEHVKSSARPSQKQALCIDELIPHILTSERYHVAAHSSIWEAPLAQEIELEPSVSKVIGMPKSVESIHDTAHDSQHQSTLHAAAQSIRDFAVSGLFYSIRGLAVLGTLESAVSKPAVATRNLHETFSMNSKQSTPNNYTKNDKCKKGGAEVTDEQSPWQFLSLADARHVHQASWGMRELVTLNTPWFIDDAHAHYVASLCENKVS